MAGFLCDQISLFPFIVPFHVSQARFTFGRVQLFFTAKLESSFESVDDPRERNCATNEHLQQRASKYFTSTRGPKNSFELIDPIKSILFAGEQSRRRLSELDESSEAPFQSYGRGKINCSIEAISLTVNPLRENPYLYVPCFSFNF